MKKGIMLLFIVFFLTGCINIKDSTYEGIISFALQNEKEAFQNKTSQGYSYYLPKGLSILEDNNNNVILKSDKYTMYLYLDLISYYNKVKEEYKEKSTAFFSKTITNGEKFGYLEINLKEKNKYLIEIMYNYAKIEVIVENRDIKEMLSYAMAILSSISYNDTIIASMIGEDILNASEIEFNIFETAKNESNLIEYDENTTTSDKNKENIPDMDLIN